MTFLAACISGPDTTTSSAASVSGNGAAAGAASGTDKKTTVCHIPPGNPANWHYISVGNPAVDAHLAHGDKIGACAEIDGPGTNINTNTTGTGNTNTTGGSDPTLDPNAPVGN